MQLKRIVEFENKPYCILIDTHGTERLPIGMCDVTIYEGKKGIKLHSASIPTEDFDFIEIAKEAFREFKLYQIHKRKNTTLMYHVMNFNKWNGEIKL